MHDKILQLSQNGLCGFGGRCLKIRDVCMDLSHISSSKLSNYDNRKRKSYSVTILQFNLFLFAGDKKISILRKKQNRYSSISLSDI